MNNKKRGLNMHYNDFFKVEDWKIIFDNIMMGIIWGIIFAPIYSGLEVVITKKRVVITCNYQKF